MKPAVKEVCRLKTVAKMAKWAAALSREQWGPVLMKTGPWNGFDVQARPVIAEVMKLYPGHRSLGAIISYIPPDDLTVGSVVHPHVDALPANDWLIRIHVPLQTNPESVFYGAGTAYHMAVGKAYGVDITREHYNRNPGPLARIHFWFDVIKP